MYISGVEGERVLSPRNAVRRADHSKADDGNDAGRGCGSLSLCSGRVRARDTSVATGAEHSRIHLSLWRRRCWRKSEREDASVKVQRRRVLSSELTLTRNLLARCKLDEPRSRPPPYHPLLSRTFASPLFLYHARSFPSLRYNWHLRAYARASGNGARRARRKNSLNLKAFLKYV